MVCSLGTTRKGVMEHETNILHLLTQHPIILFVIGAVIIVGLAFVIGYLFGRGSDRNNPK